MAKKKTVLVVDDERTVTDALSLWLIDNGYEVTAALTGREGLERFKQQRVDIVITDLRLPDISGFELIAAIRQKDSNVPIIVITALSTPQLVSELLRQGVI